jgi:serine/threonine protein kinase
VSAGRGFRLPAVPLKLTCRPRHSGDLVNVNVDPSLSVRSVAARDVARDVLRRRAGGQDVSDASVIAEHGDLLPELKHELRKLAVIHRAAAAPHASGSSAAPTQAGPPSDARLSPTDRFPGYGLIREIARGGQGAVYEALQHGTNRRVAIKLIHRGRSERGHDFARFEREVQILAQLKHPNIVAIHDSGTLGEDAYFVMEYIEGLPLDKAILDFGFWISDFSERSSAPPRSERDVVLQSKIQNPKSKINRVVHLFAEICEAVSAAHLRGFIHRDLKPANIRVTPAGAPIILDFGLAKISHQSPVPSFQTPVKSESSSGPESGNWQLATGNFTETGQFVGSLPWSSPEQAAGRVHEIDLRADVYAIGVMLYQALTGRFPYEVSGPLRDVIDRILHSDPLPLRSGLNVGLARLIDQDLEAIVLRCLAKEPPRRYQSAGDLARDLRCYLRGDAIDARRDSAGYVLRKIIRRHRVAFSVAAAFTLLVTASAVVLALQAQQIRKERDLATKARDAEHNARVSSERVTHFVENMVAGADPFSDPEHRTDLTLLQAINQSAGEIERQFADEPLIEASVRTVLGRTYRELGAYSQAEAHFARALELRERELASDHPDTAETLHEWAVLRKDQTRYADADELCSRALAIRASVLGETSDEVASSRNLRAIVLRELDRVDEAESEARLALAIRGQKLADNDPLIAESLNTLGIVLRKSGKLDEADDRLSEALRRRRRAFGDEHPDVATSLNNLAALRLQQRRPDEAARLLHDSLATYRARLGDSHPSLAPTLMNLGNALTATGEFPEAEQRYREALSISRAAHGGDDSYTATIEYALAVLLDRDERRSESQELLIASLDKLERTLGLDHTTTQRALKRLIAVSEKLNDTSRAARLREKVRTAADK